MGNLIKGLKVAAYVAEIIVAGSVVIELAEKYSGNIVANLEKRRLPRVKSRPLMLRLKTDSTSVNGL